MQWVFDEQGRIKDRVVLGVVLGALVLGLVLYSVVPSKQPAARAATPTAAILPDDDATTTGGGVVTEVEAGPLTSGLSPVAATAMVQRIVGGGTSTSPANATTDGLDTPSGPSTGGTPSVPSAPAAECPTAPVSDAYEDVADQLAAALEQRVPRDNLRLLVEIAAGCSDETPTTPLLGLALDIARMVPSTGLPPFDLGIIPAVPAPEIPQPVIDALAPLNDQIMEACGNVGLLGVIVAVVPSTASIPVNGSDLADLLVPAQSLCAQFEPEYD